MYELAVSEYGNKDAAKYWADCKIGPYCDWCAVFVLWCYLKSGRKLDDDEARGKLIVARNWLSMGLKPTAPRLGDIVVFWRGSPTNWRGHVGFYFHKNDSTVWTLGGNQGGRVCIKGYPEKRLLGVVRL